MQRWMLVYLLARMWWSWEANLGPETGYQMRLLMMLRSLDGMRVNQTVGRSLSYWMEDTQGQSVLFRVYQEHKILLMLLVI